MSEIIELKSLRKKGWLAVGILLIALSVVPVLSADDAVQKPIQPQALTFMVTNTADSGPGSLRQAIINANTTLGLDMIHFNIPGTGLHTIKPVTALPEITNLVVIDGLTQPGASNASWPPTLKIELDYASNVVSEQGLNIQTNNCLIRGLVINGASGNGIHIAGSSNQIKCNFLGTDPSGTLDRGNYYAGVSIAGLSSTNNLIGGTAPGEGNLISGNETGISLLQVSGNVVQGNYIGTNAQGTAALPNINGVYITWGQGNTIGGTAAGARNLISGNQEYGVVISGNPASGNTVAGNYIGTDVTGSFAVGNGGPGTTGAGVLIKDQAHDNTIGGTAAGARNVISGNRSGIRIGGVFNYDDQANHNYVQGNYIGTSASGLAALGNTSVGISVDNSADNLIGGTTAAARNIISSSGLGWGVGIFGVHSTGNLLQGNYIGTDVTGTMDRGNVNGVTIGTSASFNVVGGTSAGERNIISGNGLVGVRIETSGTTGNRVEGNYIGLNVSGITPLGNGGNGVKIYNGASGNTIGGVTPGTGNKIAYSSLAGVRIESAVAGNRVLGNSIYANGGLGIDLISGPQGLEGVTNNDFTDGDTGPNNLQNYPILAPVSQPGVVTGSLSTLPSSTYRLEFFANSVADPSGHGEGEIYLGTKNVTTSNIGVATFTFNYTPVAGKPFISATATQVFTGDTSEFSPTAAPTAVTLDSFDAKGYDGGVLLAWRTGFEANNLGFRLYREAAGNRQLVNQEAIAGSALTAGLATVLAAGQNYTWWDELPADAGGVQYWLEDLDLSGQSTWHGPFFVSSVGGKPPVHSPAELLSRRGRLQSGMTRPATRNSEAIDQLGKPDLQQAVLTPTEVNLASQPAVKIATRGEGWYKVGRQELLAAGLDANANPKNLQMYVAGVERPFIINGEEDGKFDEGDTLEFYAEGLESASTDLQVHWLVEGKQAGLRIARVESETGTISGEHYAYRVARRDRTIYFSALRNGERENFFGPVITASPVDQSITLRQVDVDASEQAQLEVTLQGVTMQQHRVGISFNGTEVGEALFANQERDAISLSLPQSLVREGANEIKLTALGGAADISLVDDVRLTYRRKFVAENNQLAFTASGKQQVILTGFTVADIRVIDVTNPAEVKEVVEKIEPSGEGYAATVNVSGDGERHLLAVAVEQARLPVSVTQNVPSKWRHKSNGADLILITRAELAAALTPLKALRQSQGLAVEIVDIEDLYDEFNDGQKSPQAIKDFLAYAKRYWKRKPGYVLLGADASLDPKNYLGLGDFDLVPTKLLDSEFMETASDDWLADFDDDGLAELAVGRLPFRSVEEANRMVAKLIGYEKSPRRDSLLLVADVNDGFDFAAALSGLKPLVPVAVNVQEIERNDGEPFEVRQKLMEAIGSGQKIVNYAGHGSVNLWRGGLMSSEEATGMTNTTLPLFVMMACLNGYFQDPGIDSLAESLIKAEGGGAIAVWASTGMTLPEPQGLMNQEFYRQLFGQGSINRLGELVRRAKAAIYDNDVRKTWVLIGDPTLKIR